MEDASKMTVCGALEGLASGAFSSVELTRAMIGAIEKRDAEIGAFVSVDDTAALAMAAEADARRKRGEGGVLLGVPLALKDNIHVSGQPCGCASWMLRGYHALYDATVMERLKAAGAVFLGRTNMDEFALGSTGETSCERVTRNPVVKDRVPGGSSGGSAAAVAGGMALAALGTDTGGSIRQPASHCGCVGVKPSYGRVSRYGVVAGASSMDQVGTLTKNVRDAALLLGALAGQDERDATSLDVAVPDYVAALKGGVKGMRFGLPKEFFVKGADAEVLARVNDAVKRLEAAGAQIVEVSLPHSEYAVATYYVCMTAEVSANLARFDGVRYGFRAEGAEDVNEVYFKTRTQGFGMEVKRRIILGTFVLSSGYADAYYHRALKVRTLIRRDFERAFEKCDALLAPVAPDVAPQFGSFAGDPLKAYLGDIFTVSANLAGVCGLSVPCGTTTAGCPVGLQMIGPAFGEATILRAAHAFEQL